MLVSFIVILSFGRLPKSKDFSAVNKRIEMLLKAIRIVEFYSKDTTVLALSSKKFNDSDKVCR